MDMSDSKLRESDECFARQVDLAIKESYTGVEGVLRACKRVAEPGLSACFMRLTFGQRLRCLLLLTAMIIFHPWVVCVSWICKTVLRGYGRLCSALANVLAKLEN